MLREILHRLCRLGPASVANLSQFLWAEEPLNRLVGAGVLRTGSERWTYGLGVDRHFALAVIASMSALRLSQLFREGDEFELYLSSLRNQTMTTTTGPEVIHETPNTPDGDDQRWEALKEKDIFTMSDAERSAITAYQVFQLRAEVHEYCTALGEHVRQSLSALVDQVVTPGFQSIEKRLEALDEAFMVRFLSVMGRLDALPTGEHVPLDGMLDQVGELLERRLGDLENAFDRRLDELLKSLQSSDDMTGALNIAARREVMIGELTDKLLKGLVGAIDRRTRTIERSSDATLLAKMQQCPPDLDRFRYMVNLYNRMIPTGKVSEKLKASAEQMIAMAALDSIKTTPNYEWMTHYLENVDPNLISFRQALLAEGESVEPLWEALEDGLDYDDIGQIINSTEIAPMVMGKDKVAIYRDAIVSYRKRRAK